MARVFTIAPGLENMGGLKTGGQGSVYKGRRTGEIITAVKILPTPVFNESPDDKNLIAFENEVAKLKKVNETPNPHVVKMIGAGISDTGNFPFIEMEYIEGQDLLELLQSPDNPIFTIAETIKVAEQLASALGHCHQLGVRHGDIKSSNIKLNSETGNYILLDFGLAIMSDEQRRSSVGQAGAIEYMAPEQSTGQMLYQTDVYSYGVVLFELLTGSVPFSLRDKSNSAHNDVRLAHLASSVPGLFELRRLAMPLSWDNTKRQHEMQVPGWLINLIYKCLEKKPGNRFANGNELHSYLLQNLFSKADNTASLAEASNRQQVNQSLFINHKKLENELSDYRQELLKKEGELITLKELLDKKDEYSVKSNPVKTIQPVLKSKVVSTSSFIILLLITFALAAFAIVPVFKNRTAANGAVVNPATVSSRSQQNDDNTSASVGSGTLAAEEENADNLKQLQTKQESQKEAPDELVEKINKQETGKQTETESVFEKPVQAPAEEKPVQEKTAQEKITIQIPAEQNNEVKTTEQRSEEQVKQPAEKETQDKKKDKLAVENNDDSYSGGVAVSKKYLVVLKAYFFNEPDENTRRDEFISPFEHAVVQALNERYGFVYVVITNPQGQVFKGWLRKRDLKLFSI